MKYSFFAHLTLLLVIFYSSNLWAEQEQQLSLLKAKLLEYPIDSAQRVTPLLRLSSMLLFTKPERSEHYAKQAVPLAEQHQDKISYAKALRLLGQAQMFQGLNQQAQASLNSAIEAARETNSANLISVANRATGVFYELILDHDLAMQYYIEAMRYAKQSTYPEDLAIVLNNIGNILNSKGSHLEAVDYFKKSIEINQQIPDIDMEMNSTVGLAISDIKANELALAKTTLQHIISHMAVITDFTFSEAYVNLAHVNRLEGDYSQAIERYKYVIQDTKAGAYPPAIAAAYLGLGVAYELNDNITQARDIYQQGLVAVKGKSNVESELALYQNLAQLELRLGNFKQAFEAQSSYIQRRNEIQPFSESGKISKLENQLTIEREHIELQQQLLENERSTQATLQYLLLVMSLLFLFTCAALITVKKKQS